MKPIAFQESASKKIYDSYIKRIKRTTSTLPKEDRNEVLLEFNSHIYEGMQRNSDPSEVDAILAILQKLGEPEDVLKPLIAKKKLLQATRTFNPLHIAKALVLNIANGVSYVFFAFLYILLFGFGYIIVEKIRRPEEVGLFFVDGQFETLGTMGGYPRDGRIMEVLGNGFIPVMILVTMALFVLITLLLRMKQRFIK